MSGRMFGSGFWPLMLVGANIHWPEASRFEVEQELVSQPFAAIHFACGATPIWFGPGSPSSPTIVPVVCVPCPLLSHGAGAADTRGVVPVVVVVEGPSLFRPRYFMTSAVWV